MLSLIMWLCINVLSVLPYPNMQGSKRVVMVDSLHRFGEYIETSELNLPSSTIAFEEEGKVSSYTMNIVAMY